MKINLTGVKTAIIVIVLFCSCSLFEDDILQVYDEFGNPVIDTFELVGLPAVRLDSGYYPWKLYGKINNGIMNIDFPAVKLELGRNTNHSLVYIERKNYSSTKFSLQKQGKDDNDIIYIYYSTENLHLDDYYEIGNTLTLKPGWNFIEVKQNPKWAYGNNEPYYIFKLISQDINSLYKKGYRWRLERWN